MCFLSVFIFNLVCFCILALSCTASAPDNPCLNYKEYQDPQVYMKVTRQNDSTCITLEKLHEINKTIYDYTFRQHDNMTLECNRVGGKALWNITREITQLQWKLEQVKKNLMITEGISIYNKLLGSNSTTVNLDRYDDGLIAICCTNGSEQNHSISVQFKYIGERNGADTNEDILSVTVKEGDMVRNEFANPVIVYNTPTIERKPRVVLQNGNIFDSITLEDNGTVYAGWAEEGVDVRKNQTITNIVKTKWVIYVEPTNPGDRSLFFAIIGGISFIVFAIIIAVCCYCWKKNKNSIENPYAEVYEVAHVQPNQYQVNNPNPTPEEGDYVQMPSQNDRVEYAQIDIRRADKPTPIQDREPYAKIIGVMRPNKNGQNVAMFKG